MTTRSYFPISVHQYGIYNKIIIVGPPPPAAGVPSCIEDKVMPPGHEHCFAACATCNSHTVGRWVPRSAPSPYRLNYSLWGTLGLSGPPASSSQHYGLCDDRHLRLSLGPRQLYDWETEQCELPHFDRARACSLFAGRQVVVVGDSTAGQLFLSLVLQLGGTFGRNSRHTSVISDLTASACEDRTRLNFVRNDLLLWSTHRSDFNRARECDKLLKADGFVQRAVRDADYLVLQTGHHFPASIEAAAMTGGAVAAATTAGFFASSLNHTLTHLLRARRLWGHRPSTVTLMGISIPIPGCSSFMGPLDPGGWLAANAHNGRRSKYAPRWQAMPRLNSLLRWMAIAFGTSFVDIAAPSAGWPSGMMARYTKAAGTPDEDCLHSCLPGPVDTYSRLLVESLLHSSSREALGMPREASGIPRAAGSAFVGAGSKRGKPSAAASRRFFSVSRDTWLHDRNGGAQFESGCRGTACVHAGVAHQPWWPFVNWCAAHPCDCVPCAHPSQLTFAWFACPQHAAQVRDLLRGRRLHGASAHTAR